MAIMYMLDNILTHTKKAALYYRGEENGVIYKVETEPLSFYTRYTPPDAPPFYTIVNGDEVSDHVKIIKKY